MKVGEEGRAGGGREEGKNLREKDGGKKKKKEAAKGLDPELEINSLKRGSVPLRHVCLRRGLINRTASGLLSIAAIVIESAFLTFERPAK